MRLRFSVGLIQRSAAHTWTPNSFARNMELSARPQPRSRTRMPGWNSNTWLSDSASQSAFGPIMLSATHFGSYIGRAREGGVVKEAAKIRLGLVGQLVQLSITMVGTPPRRAGRSTAGGCAWRRRRTRWPVFRQGSSGNLLDQDSQRARRAQSFHGDREPRGEQVLTIRRRGGGGWRGRAE